MARPKKVNPELKPEQGNTPETIAVAVAEPEILASIPAEVQPEFPDYTVENQTGYSSVQGRKLPEIRAGVCEFCGAGEFDLSSPQRLVIDKTVVPETQLGRCKHYNGVKIRCIYCPANSDWVDNIRHRKHFIWQHSQNPKMLIICCDDMACRDKHYKRANVTH